MNLTMQILHIIVLMQRAFLQARSYKRFACFIFAILCTAGRHTVTSFIYFSKMEKEDWTKFYRFFNKIKWNPDICFDVLTEVALKEVISETDDIVIALDDFRVRKVGKTIPHSSYQLDPRSPPFNRNFMWGHRYIHASLLIIQKKENLFQAARSISIRIDLAPHLKKPGKKASEEDWKNYQVAKKEFNMCQQAGRLIGELRKLIDKLGYSHKKIIMVVDGGYCNKAIFSNLPDRVELIARCRKDAKLCHKSQTARKFYDDKKFTPQDIYKDDKVATGKSFIYYGRRLTEIQHKEKIGVYWQKGAQKRTLRNVVVFGVKYRRNKNGYENYREPMYLLTTNLSLNIGTIIQYYLYRWEIEVTHRELKNDLGISQAQVTNAKSVERCPKTVCIANSIIKLAYEMIPKEVETAKKVDTTTPKWYRNRKRISLTYLRKWLRQEIIEIPNSEITWQSLFENIAA